MPIVLILIAISLFLSFRTITGMLLPIISVLVSTVWTIGIMSILNIPLTIITNCIPVILIAIGSAYNVHIINKFYEEASTGNDAAKSSQFALSTIGTPVILSAVTTAAGFIAFIFGSYLSMIRDFGIFSSIGVLFALITSITFVPSILSVLPQKIKKARIATSDAPKITVDRFMESIGRLILKNEKLIFIILIVAIVASIIAIPEIGRKVNMLDYFEEGNIVRITEEIMEEKFGGSIPIQILVKGDIQNPALLKEMKKMGDFLESMGNIHNAQSVADLIEEMSDVMDEGKTIPDSKAKVVNLWFLIEGEEIMSQLVNSNKTEAVIQATMTDINTERIQELVIKVNNYIKKIDTSVGSFSQTGIPSIYQHLDDSIMSSQVQSLILAIILVFICITLLLNSIYGGLIGLAPIGVTLVFIFGFMGYSSIPLDIVTVLIGSISLGIGIDYSIHFISRFKNEFSKSSSKEDALFMTLRTSGKAIIINVATVTAGFIVFVLATLVPTQRFGVLISLTMIAAGFCSITLLPSIILLSKARFVGNWDELAGRVSNNIKNKISDVGKK
ncbi:MAG: MMPL family transporter, partial [Spirochaetota bacterium]|nr:MMPL family transporter [Spirochaetota bacterium]